MKFYLTILLLCYSLLGIAQQNTIPYYNTTIDIDGHLNESVWQQLSILSDFQNYYPIDEGKADNQTKVSLFHNGKNLYVSAIYTDNDKPIVSSLKRDDYVGSVLQSDCFQIVLDPFNEKTNGYFFRI